MLPNGFNSLKELLDERYTLYNRIEFIESDPISIPHRFKRKEDIEISGFLTATIAWGNRKSILNNANKMLKITDNSPYEFVLNHSSSDLKKIKNFVHRTFNGEDLITMLQCLQICYKNFGGLEKLFTGVKSHEDNLARFPENFIFTKAPSRFYKHVANINRNSAAKRLNMFLRWMVRKDNEGVDFGIWENINMSNLFIPLDVHASNTARKLGLLDRKQNDWKAVLELTKNLREFDPADPVKYDFALFGSGAFKKAI